ncbi:hypothetical protein NR798_34640 [Archangium gephyra]|uniref:hypothetical protein n=1 Tax=Archangium gephyra TaxID=48 RepID=UPI0035D4811D
MKVIQGLFLVCALGLCMQGGEAEARVRSNTQVRLPNNQYLADVTGDGVAEFIAVKGDKLFVAKTNFEAHGVLYGKAFTTIKRVFTGYFWDRTKEQICTIESDGYTDCYISNAGNTGLLTGLTQVSFVADDEHAIVGDYNADGYDDVLVFKPSTGAFRMYTRLSSGVFGLMPNFSLGNISNPNDFKNARVYAGELGTGSPRRDDLVIFEPATGRIGRYESVVDGSGVNTFWWAFWTYSLVASNEEVTLANIDGDGTDDLALHSATGGYRFFKLDYGSGGLVPLSYGAGQLSTAANANLFWGKLKSIPGEPGANRDDALVASGSYFHRADARWTGSQYTYWWVYTQQILNLDVDQDGDGILTLHELGGYDTNSDGVSETPLHSYGASPFGKDIFVEVDYMAAGTGEAESHIMKPAAVNLAVQEMAKFGINLHIFVDDPVTHATNLGNPTFDWVRDLDPIKNANFTPGRAPFFHYCLFGHNYDGGTSSGLSRGIVASDFLVTLGSWDYGTGTVEQQTGTFLHELGHNLGLMHGGVDHTHYKPNFLSVMGYLYQMSGVLKDGTRQFLYSEMDMNNLDENNLYEWSGVSTGNTNGNRFQTYLRGPGYWVTVNNAVDFDGNGFYNSGARRDLNGDGAFGILYGGPNEYARLNFRGGSVGSAGMSLRTEEQDPFLQTVLRDELTVEQYLEHVAPLERELPPLDTRSLDKPVRTYQPLFLKP